MPRLVAHVVVHVYDERRDYVLHYNIFEYDAAYLANSAPAAPRLYAEAALGAAEDTALHVNVFDSARAFAAEHYAAVAAFHEAIGYFYVPAGRFIAAGKLERARLYRYTVVADGDIYASNVDPLATVGVDAVRRGHGRYIVQAEVIQLYVFAEIGMHVPRGRVAHGYALHEHVLAAVEEHAAGAPRYAHCPVVYVPVGVLLVAVYHAFAYHRYVAAADCGEHRGKAVCLLPLPRAEVAARFPLARDGGKNGIFRAVGFADEARALIEPEGYSAL